MTENIEDRVLDAARRHGISFARLEAIAKEEGVARGEATEEQYRAILERIEQPQAERAPAAVQREGLGSGSSPHAS